jgi:hypothetical protein
MAKPLSQILSETFDTGDPRANHAKWYVRRVNKEYYGRFKWNSGKNAFIRVGGKYQDKDAAVQAAKVSAL